jgi:hypothetical protein
MTPSTVHAFTEFCKAFSKFTETKKQKYNQINYCILMFDKYILQWK